MSFIPDILKFKQEINELIDFCISPGSSGSEQNNRQRIIDQMMSHFNRLKIIYDNRQSDNDEDEEDIDIDCLDDIDDLDDIDADIEDEIDDDGYSMNPFSMFDGNYSDVFDEDRIWSLPTTSRKKSSIDPNEINSRRHILGIDEIYDARRGFFSTIQKNTEDNFIDRTQEYVNGIGVDTEVNKSTDPLKNNMKKKLKAFNSDPSIQIVDTPNTEYEDLKI